MVRNGLYNVVVAVDFDRVVLGYVALRELLGSSPYGVQKAYPTFGVFLVDGM
jgi:hypothetical protein